ncbi:MAG TPA: hypothetical protein VF609_02645 [Flavisolibacter sp.]|jgi:hypothetical protein
MSFLKQLLNPFIEFDADKKQAAPPPVQQPLPPVQKPAAAPAPPVNEPAEHPLITGQTTPAPDPVQQLPTYSPSGTLVEPLPEHVTYFEKLIDDANRTNPVFQGTDFKEFVDSKLDIDDITDEALKYRTAYNVLKSTGLTKEKLLSTGQEYLNLIGRDLNAFQGAHAQKYQKEVRQKETVIQKKAEELQVLAQRMNSLKTEINQLTQEINLTKEKLDTTKNSFLLAGERKQNEIASELQKIVRYFSNT